MLKMEWHWTPECMKCTDGSVLPNVKWRILRDGETPVEWFYIECKGLADEEWQGGLAGTREWLSLTDDECAQAYLKKKHK